MNALTWIVHFNELRNREDFVLKHRLNSDFCWNDFVFSSANNLFAPWLFSFQVKNKLKSLFFEIVSFALSILEAVDFAHFYHGITLLAVFGRMVHINDSLDFVAFRIHQVKSQAWYIVFWPPLIKIVNTADDLKALVWLVKVWN